MDNPAMRRWPWTLTLVLTAALTVVCSNTTEGTAATNAIVRRGYARDEGLLSRVLELPTAVARALRRIRESPRDYRLVDDVWFERTPQSVNIGHEKPTSKSPPSSGDLFGMTDAVFDTHHLLWRNPILEGIDLKIYKDKSQRYTFDLALNNDINNKKAQYSDGRTFGSHRRRMVHIMLPIMYKLGVITTLLFGLTLLSIKGVTIGLVLLMLGLSSLVMKLTKPHHHSPPHSFEMQIPPPWSPPVHEIYDRSFYHQSQPHSKLQPQPQQQTHPQQTHPQQIHPQQIHQQQTHPQQLQEKNVHVHVHTAPSMTKNNPSTYFDRDTSYSPPDDPPNSGRGDSNWNYDAVMNTYYQKGPNGYNSIPKTTTSSAYTHWTG